MQFVFSRHINFVRAVFLNAFIMMLFLFFQIFCDKVSSISNALLSWQCFRCHFHAGSDTAS